MQTGGIGFAGLAEDNCGSFGLGLDGGLALGGSVVSHPKRRALNEASRMLKQIPFGNDKQEKQERLRIILPSNAVRMTEVW